MIAFVRSGGLDCVFRKIRRLNSVGAYTKIRKILRKTASLVRQTGSNYVINYYHVSTNSTQCV